MIRLTVHVDATVVQVVLDAPYSPDVLEDTLNRATGAAMAAHTKSAETLALYGPPTHTHTADLEDDE